MATLKTQATGGDVTAFLDAVPAAGRRADAHALRALIERVTGSAATMWGPSIVGFGSQPYTNTTGTHDWFAVGFSPRKAAMTIYGIHDGDGPADPLLDELGPHTTGKGCLYVKRLADVDEAVLERLVRDAWERSTSGRLAVHGPPPGRGHAAGGNVDSSDSDAGGLTR
jgi:hypothetical protein